MTTDMELEPLIIQEDSDIHVPEVRPRRPPTDLPHAEDSGKTEDCLDDVSLSFVDITEMHLIWFAVRFL